MKILVTSDTHGQKQPLKQLITQYNKHVQMVIHLGDYAHDLLGMAHEYPHITAVAVAGAVDFGVDNQKILTIEGRKLLLVHGHMNGVKSGIDRLFYYAKEKQVDVCLFGHTHFQTMFEKENILFMNPGSLVEPRGGSVAGYGIIDISPEGEITSEVIQL